VHAAAKDFLRIAIGNPLVETVDAFLNFMRCIRDAYDGNPVQHLIDIYLSPP
jgi:cobalamin biosynthesis Co2+ chelatase CbiK